MIYISTGGIRNKSAAASALEMFRSGIKNVELSSGLFSDSCEEDLLALPTGLNLQIHNYFPPPKIPFVFNLAALDKKTAEASMSHAINAIKLAANLGIKRYSFHAGFRFTPAVSELGNSLSLKPLVDLTVAKNLFIDRVLLLSNISREYGVQLLVENNVINIANYMKYGENPLLMTDSESIINFFTFMPGNVSLLLDVAHLKVSSVAQSFDLQESHNKLKPFIGGYHLSDNDGFTDSNGKVNTNSWFWNDIKKDLDYYTLEVYKASHQELIEQSLLVEQMLRD